MTFDMFSTCVKYQFKSTSHCVHTFMLLIIVMTLILPVIIIRYSGDFWIKDWSFMEEPIINFKYQYLLIAESDIDSQPIVCSTFSHYKDSPISDDCILMKIHEVDTNNNDKNDVLKFEARFFSDRAIRVLKLLLLFRCELKSRVRIGFDTTVTMDYNLVHDFQKIRISGNLLLLQQSTLRDDVNYLYSSDKVEYDGFLLFLQSTSNFSRIFSAKVENRQVSWQSGFARDEEVVVLCEIFYNGQPIHYSLGAWEQYKWAWIQYVSLLIVLMYVVKYLVSIALTKRYLSAHVILPWKKMN